MTLISTPTLVSSRLYNVKANGPATSDPDVLPNDYWTIYFLGCRSLVATQLCSRFSAICPEHRSIWVGAKKKRICVKVQDPALQMHHDISVKPFIQCVASVSDLKEGCVILTGSCHQNPSTFFNYTHKNATERVISPEVRICPVSSDRGKVACTVVFERIAVCLEV